MSSESTLHPCIYCREVDVPRTREHVLQSGFGANAVLATAVCAVCNNAFSGIDKYFIDAVNRWHLGNWSLASLGLGAMADGSGGVLAARMENDATASLFPQFVLGEHEPWRFHGPDEKLFQAMLDELEQPGIASIRSRVVMDEEMPRCRVLRSAPKRYLVEGRDASVVEAMADGIRRRGLKLAWQHPSSEREYGPAPQITFNANLDLNRFCRAMVKIAVNFVCHKFGAEVALYEGLDCLRRFARYDEGNGFDYVVPSILNHTIVAACAAFFAEQHHGIQLVNVAVDSSRRQHVFVAIAGVTVGRVDFPKGEKALPLDVWIVGTRFTPTSGHMEEYRLPEDIRRAVVNPAALGLQHLWPEDGPERQRA